MKAPHCGIRPGGFSLVEVMIALLVISVGLLGIAKMQALAMSNTSGAKMRSLAAHEAASLAAAMHADRAYWSKIVATTAAPFLVTTSNSNIVAPTTDGNLMAAAPCTKPAPAACSTVQMAAYDLKDWVAGYAQTGTAGLSAQLPNPQSTITCYSPAANTPVGCSIQITWNENFVTTNTAKANAAAVAAVQRTTYTLYVEP